MAIRYFVYRFSPKGTNVIIDGLKYCGVHYWWLLERFYFVVLSQCKYLTS